MKRSITIVGATLGSAALIALGLGCSRQERPAQAAPSGTTSPTFESNVPPSNAPSAETPNAAPERGTAQPQAPEQGETRMTPTPGATGEQGAQQRGTEAPQGATTERMLCDTLAGHAKLHVEDVQNGVAIVATPKAGHELSTVRDNARRIESAARQRTPGETAAPAGESCSLISIGRLPSVTTTVTEGASTVRIVMTTSNATEVKDLRRAAHDQVSTLSKGR